MQLTLLNARLSMSKVPHLVLFALFFLVTLVQYDRVSAQSVRVALLVTLALGLLVELEEGASRTGNCRLTDVLPDVAGAAMAGILVVGLIALWRRNAAPGTSSPRTLSNRADR
jgi:VanZ family protein